ncbi:diphthamide synthesis protein, partial [Candidatus Woesearchaeota archaeon]|nr:diphthamide synthesis protein [Candidatus Woesearchaeota archaeon]
MKTFFIHATAQEDIKLTEEALKQLPKKIGIVTNAQHIAKLSELKKQLPNSIIAGQVLGCRADNAQRITEQVDAFLFIGGGAFHPLFVAVKTQKPVYCWNPADKMLTKITRQQIEAYKQNKQRQLNIFYAAQTIGVL